METGKSTEAFNRALKSIPGGVNSPARALKSVGSNPLFIEKAEDSAIFDIDGNEFIDYVGSWGPMILGHAHPEVVSAVREAALSGTSYGAPTILEIQLAELIKDMVPSIESVRMVNSGTEATMSALRLARGFTGRDKVVKFEGCYHGHGDSFLIKAGSGALTHGEPDSPGVTKGTAKDTLNAVFNDAGSVENLFSLHGDNIAAVIIEPVTGNMGVVEPDRQFLQAVRSLCTMYGAILIFDEVMTGFRLAKGGAQELLDISPDLTTLGKIIGGGLPVGAYGGRKDIMDRLSPSGPVYQAGTLSGNPVAMAAGIATLKIINNNDDLYNDLESKSALLADGLLAGLREAGIPGVVNRAGSMFTLFFTGRNKVTSYSDVMSCDTRLFARYFNGMLGEGIYIAPSQFEACFVSSAHTARDIENTIEKSRKVLAGLITDKI
ncbi:MAG: glutamate-1-semialdehyde 2,1-aminomutase [Bacteroidales bacterium]